MSVKHKTFSAVRWTTASAITRAVLQIVQVAALARLLKPEDYGLMAMVGVVLSFAGLFADFGVNSAFVQRREVTQAQRSSLFWFNVALSAALTFFLIAGSPIVAGLLGDARLTPLLMLSASIFVISALGQQVRMAAEKDLEFRLVVFLEVAAAVVGLILALTAATWGCGVYSLALGAISAAVFGTVCAWLFLARGWRPMWCFKMEDVRPYLSFGGAIVVNNVVNQVNATLDLLLGGRLLGAAQLGFYSVPRNVVLQVQALINPVVTRVGFPLIAQLQNDVMRVKAIYLKTVNMTASTNALLYVWIGVAAPEIVTVLLGGQWQSSAYLLRILAAWGFFRSVANPVGSLLFGMGRATLALKWNLGLLLIAPPLVYLGSLYGPGGLAWMLLALGVLVYIPAWWFLIRPLCQAGIYEYSVASLRPFLLALASVIPAYWAAAQLNGAFGRLAASGMISIIFYLALSRMFNREWVTAMGELVGRPRGRIFE